MSRVEDVVVVGSGPSGVGAALGLVEKGIRPLILDVGNSPAPDLPHIEDFYRWRKDHDAFDLMIGKNYEGLHNILKDDALTPKLTAPYMTYVVRDAEHLSPLKERGFKAIQSFACGGLANAWGAGLYRFNDRDLEGIPLSAAQLAPYYDALTEEIGILGADDDLTRYFGSTASLHDPLPLSAKSARLAARYEKKRKALNKAGVFLGQPRLGIISRDHRGRSAAGNYPNMDTWVPHLPALYNPAYTLQRLIDQDKITYRKNCLVLSWQRKGKELSVLARDLDSGEIVAFKTRKLVLAAGTVNTSRIVLQSRRDYDTALPLWDNPLVQVPLVHRGSLGSKLEPGPFGMGHLNVIFDLQEFDMLLQGGILEINSPARALFFDQFPLAGRDNLRMIRLVTNAVQAMLLFFPSNAGNAAQLRLTKEGTLEITCRPYSPDPKIVAVVCRALRRLGVFAAPPFTQVSPPGYGIHYAGTLPMGEQPRGPYCCNTRGELSGEPGVFVVDGAVLPQIPAKNLSLTLMANAMRTGADLGDTLKTEK